MEKERDVAVVAGAAVATSVVPIRVEMQQLEWQPFPLAAWVVLVLVVVVVVSDVVVLLLEPVYPRRMP